MSKYEFKEFSYDSYLSDMAEGWNPTFRISEDFLGQDPRPVEIIDLGPQAEIRSRLASIDIRNGGEVRLHDMHGMFYPTEGKCCLDLVLYREAGPKPKEIRGVAYVSEKGQVVTVSPDYIDQEAENCKAVRCTITLHEPV